MIHMHRGDYSEALKALQQALDISRSDSKFRLRLQEERTIRGMAVVYQAMGHHEKALELCQQAGDISAKFQRKGIDDQVARFNEMGMMYSQLKRYDRALEQSREAPKLCKKFGLPTKTSDIIISGIYMDMVKITEAEPYVKQAGNDATSGRFSLLKADYSHAKAHYESILAASEKNGDVDGLFTAYTGLGKVYTRPWRNTPRQNNITKRA